jgi:8-oxo-dGTP pyrophosphatase MutT (NUDIX family)
MIGSHSESPDGCSAAGVPRILGSRVVYEGRVVTMRVDEIEMSAGKVAKREVVEHPGAVVILALDDIGRVYLVKQYRHPIRGMLLELPAGAVEEAEDPLAAAKRELREEVGLEAKAWSSLGSFFSSPGFANEHLHVFLAEGLVETERDPDEDEDLTIERCDVGDLLSHLEVIPDAKSLAALLLLLRHPDYGTQYRR